MRFALARDGSWLVDPGELACHVGVSACYLQRQMTLGLVSSRVEAGSGADEGLSRVTVCLAATGWEAVFDARGGLVSERRFGTKTVVHGPTRQC